MGLVARQPRLVTRDNRSTRRAPRATHADNDRHPETPIPANGHTFRAIEANRNRPGKITCITVRVVRSRSATSTSASERRVTTFCLTAMSSDDQPLETRLAQRARLIDRDWRSNQTGIPYCSASRAASRATACVAGSVETTG